MKFARHTRNEVEVNLTPLIDVVFLLLIFFMVSTTFTKDTQLSIDLPEASTTPGTLAERTLEISISRSGEFAINEVALINNQLKTLINALQKVSAGDNTLPLIITADSETPHQSVVTAMDAAGQLGFSHLSISTKNFREQN